MAIVLKINPEVKDRRVSHNRVNAKTVEAHTAAELKQLAIEARKSENLLLIECFIDLPTLEELTADKVTTQVAAVKPAPIVPAEEKK